MTTWDQRVPFFMNNFYSLLHRFHQPCAGNKGPVVCFLSVALFMLHKFLLLLSLRYSLNMEKCNKYLKVWEHCVTIWVWLLWSDSAAYWHTFAFPYIQTNQCFLFKSDFIFYHKCLYSNGWWENFLETKEHLVIWYVCGCFSL